MYNDSILLYVANSTTIATSDQIDIQGLINPSLFISTASLIISFLTVSGIGGLLFYSVFIKRKIKEKQPEVLFGYYSKMIVHLSLIKSNLLNENNTPLLYLLNENTRNNCKNLPKELYKERLVDSVDDYIRLLKSAEWQFPINETFNNEIKNLFEKSLIILGIDVYHDYENENQIKQLYNDTIKLIDEICSYIKEEQNKIIQKA